MRRLGGVWPWAFALLVACRSAPAYVAKPGPYDRLSVEALEKARTARFAWEDGDLKRAHRLVREALVTDAANVPLAIFLQEIELALLQEGEEVEGRPVPTERLDAEQARALLEGFYLAQARVSQHPVPWLLAARLAPDEESRGARLEVALQLEPDFVWGHYAQAWSAYRRREFPEAREAVARALETDPGHPASRRLEANLLANAGEGSRAVRILSLWLGQAAEDPFVSSRALREARIDLAALYVSAGRAEEALELLAAVEFPEREVRARAELVRAAAYEERGDLDLALSSARLAASFAPDDLLPLVHEALLAAQGDELFPDELAAWERVLETARTQAELSEEASMHDAEAAVDFQNLLIQLQAQTYLARLREERAP